MKWQHIEYLLGLAVLPFLGALLLALLKWKKKTRERIGDPSLVEQLVKSFSRWRFLVKAGLTLAALTAVILGAANFQRPGAMEDVHRKGVDVMLVLDVSKSMLATDIKPSRLGRAKQLLIRLTDQLENDRIGLVLFAGRPYMQMPLTTDHGATRMYIQNAGPDVVPTQGTVIAESLKMANTAFNSKERKYKTIVLLSDGEDHDPEALPVAKSLAAEGVMINTVGIGSPDGAPIVDPATGELKKDEQGQTVISRLNEAELQQLADAANGHYTRLDNIDDALITLTQQLDSIEKKSLNDTEFIDYKSYFQWFLGLALLLLLVELLLPERKAVTTTPGISMFVRSLLLLLVCSGATLKGAAQNANTLIRNGNRLYKQKQLDQSQKQYEAALKKAPDDPTASYNLGNTQFRKNNFNDAVQSYDKTAKVAADKATLEKAFYNKGVALMKQQKLQESIDAWKAALGLDPSDADARQNLQKALEQKKQQQSQQQKDNKDQKKDKKDQKDQKEKKDKDQQEQQQQQPKPQPSRLNKQQVEQLLKALEQREKDIQDKMNQNKVKTPTQPEKDW